MRLPRDLAREVGMKRRLALPLLVFGLAVFPMRTEASPITLVDTLGIATPATQFDVGGTSGVPIGVVNPLNVLRFGPIITVIEPTVITEIGGFVESCLANCSTPLPARVEIHPSLNGLPDLQTVIATLVLSDDANPAIVSYESVATHLLLGPGAYFALFANQQAGVLGYVLDTALQPFVYGSGVVLGARVNTVDGSASLGVESAAVRILGDTVPEPPVLLLAGLGLAGVAAASRRRAGGASH
jgi:hypothetical protein